MNTTYLEIYEAFKDKITDYDLARYSPELQDELLLNLLRSACRRFCRICSSDLNDRDDELGEFNSELSEEDIDIITEWMVVNWLKPIKNDLDNLHNRINTNEFSSISPANMLLALNEHYENSRKHARTLMNQYSYVCGDLETLKP